MQLIELIGWTLTIILSVAFITAICMVGRRPKYLHIDKADKNKYDFYKVDYTRLQREQEK
ncbi:hypothetical protein D0469_17745 [Peribacillus saganii]|uniref:DUF3951 domain-containing protein n=1 Tax=Peribacillus saganii TaxID=2303992 RepID=A0A372LII5_9BACI|nr:hypothetical protein D0469_17745 [Peribacillus saganii]